MYLESSCGSGWLDVHTSTELINNESVGIPGGFNRPREVNIDKGDLHE